MARTTDAVDDDERWARAESILADKPTPAAAHQIRRQRAMLWLLAGAVAVLGAAVGLLVALLLRHHRGGLGDDAATWQVVVGLVLQGAALVLVFTGLVLQRRANGRRWRWNVPEAVLTREQRRGLMKQIRGRAPVEPRRLGLTRDLASRLANQRGILLLLTGLSIMFIGQAIATPSIWRVVFAGAYLVLLGAAVVAQRRLARHAQRFLDENAAPEPAPTPSVD